MPIFFNGGSYQHVHQHPKPHCHFCYLLKSYLFSVSVFAFLSAFIAWLKVDDDRLMAIFTDNWVSRHQNVSILENTGAKNDEGGEC